MTIHAPTPYNETKCCLMYSPQKGNAPKWEIFPEKLTKVAKLTKAANSTAKKEFSVYSWPARF